MPIKSRSVQSVNQNFIKELERIFKFLNKQIFENKLKVPTHIVQPDKKVVFRFVPESYAIWIGSKFATIALRDLLADYIHEMVHIENHRLGVIDLTSNQYHNKQFLETALGVGFYVGKHKNQGWALTQFAKKTNFKKPFSASEKKLSMCLQKITIDDNLINEGKTEIDRILESLTPTKTCFLKYVCSCPPPHNSIRSGRRPDGPNPLNIVCKECHSAFVEETQLGAHQNAN